VLSAKTFFACDDAMVVTNSYFTPSAKELAEAAGVRLVDRRELQRYLDEYNQTIMDQAAREKAEATVEDGSSREGGSPEAGVLAMSPAP
jgi:Restriction endonuclease